MNVITEDFSYSGDDKLDNPLRIRLDFGIEDKNLEIARQINFILDTGAPSVLVRAIDLGIRETEDQFKRKYSITPQKQYGLVPGKYVEYYRYCVSQLSIGNNIKFRDFPIYITFENNVSINLMGMTFLRLFNFLVRPIYKSVTLTTIPYTYEFITKQISMKNIDTKMLPTIPNPSAGVIIDIDNQMLEANYINSKLDLN